MKMKIYVLLLLNNWMKVKINLFQKHEYRSKLNFFSNNKLKFQPRT